jgi:hypothetical protein
MKRVFVSYSAKKEGARDFVREVVAAIDAPRDPNGAPLFTALVDLKLGEGFWRPVLYNWMALCDAAVIIIDNESPESVWLPREAMVFRLRKELNPAFPIIPVLRGVTKEVFQASAFLELGLNDLQYTEDATAATIVERLKAVVPETQAARCVADLAKQLKWIPEDPTRFDQVLPLLTSDGVGWFSTSSAEFEVAARLFGYGFRAGPFGSGVTYPGPKAIKALLPEMPAGRSGRIFDILSTYWLDRAAGANLHLGLRRGASLIALRTNLADESGWPDQFIACYQRHVDLEHSASLTHVALPVVDPLAGSGPDSLEESRRRVYSALWRIVAPQSTAEPNAANDRSRIRKTCAARKGEVVLWVRHDVQIAPEQLLAVQDEIQGLRIVLLCTDDRLRGRPRIHYIQPDLEEEFERGALDELDVARTYIPMENR